MNQLEGIRRTEDRYQLPTYAKLPISIERGEGCFVFDSEGNRYLDFYGGHCVASTGHAHPVVVEAIREQAGHLIFYSNAVYSSVRARAAELLVEACGSPFHQVFFVNSGAEANENAIKLARAITGRREVISTEHSFHGRTYGALSACGIGKYRSYLNTPVPSHTIVPAERVVETITGETAAVILEPIQSMGGVVVLPHSLLGDIRRACSLTGALLIFDEIQTGIGRTGSFLYCQRTAASPDVVCLAKGIASGYPAGAVVLTKDVSEKVGSGDLGTTFGGSALACAAIEATLKVLADEKLADNAARIGNYLRRHLNDLAQVSEVRGEGLLLGIGFKDYSAKEVQKALLVRNILAGTSYDPSILRLMPPLTLRQGEADMFLEALRQL